MRTVKIAPIIEGDGEVAAFPVLLRRIVLEIDTLVNAVVSRGFLKHRSRLEVPGGLETAIEAVAVLHPGHAILVLIDSDDDCPKDLGSELIQRANNARPDLHVSVVIAHREYEAWFLASAESLAGKRNLRPDLTCPPNPEGIRNAKGWLTEQMPPSMIYSPTVDQASLSHWMDLKLARDRSRSFRKLWKEIEIILATQCQPNANLLS